MGPVAYVSKSLSVKKVGNQPANAGGYFDDSIVKLSSNGKILFQKSVSQIFIDNGLEYLLFSVGDPKLTLTQSILMTYNQ